MQAEEEEELGFLKNIYYLFWLHWVLVADWCVGLAAQPHVGSQLPHKGFEPASPALQGRFLTPGPPGKSLGCFFFSLIIFIFLKDFYCDKSHIMLNILFYPYLTLQFSSTKYVHIVVQLSPSSISQNCHLPKVKPCLH